MKKSSSHVSWKCSLQSLLSSFSHLAYAFVPRQYYILFYNKCEIIQKRVLCVHENYDDEMYLKAIIITHTHTRNITYEQYSVVSAVLSACSCDDLHSENNIVRARERERNVSSASEEDFFIYFVHIGTHTKIWKFNSFSLFFQTQPHESNADRYFVYMGIWCDIIKMCW